jgi:hypothetical protein
LTRSQTQRAGVVREGHPRQEVTGGLSFGPRRGGQRLGPTPAAWHGQRAGGVRSAAPQRRRRPRGGKKKQEAKNGKRAQAKRAGQEHAGARTGSAMVCRGHERAGSSGPVDGQSRKVADASGGRDRSPIRRRTPIMRLGSTSACTRGRSSPGRHRVPAPRRLLDRTRSEEPVNPVVPPDVDASSHTDARAGPALVTTLLANDGTRHACRRDRSRTASAPRGGNASSAWRLRCRGRRERVSVLGFQRHRAGLPPAPVARRVVRCP